MWPIFFRRRKEDQRLRAWNMRMTEQDQMADVMKDQHRERIQEQISREKNRQYQEQKMVELSREAKKNVRYMLVMDMGSFPNLKVHHWRNFHYAVLSVRIKNNSIQGRSPNVVKVIFHTIRNCP